MAAPNLISTTSIIGKTKAEWILGSLSEVLANSANSSQVLRVNVLYVTNMGATDQTVTVDFYRGGVGYRLANALSVPVGSTAVPIAKDTSIYLEEGDSLRLGASQAGTLQYLLSYEVMS